MGLATTLAVLGAAGGIKALTSSPPKAPPPPDYTGAAQAQGQANLEAARLQARLANPNISGPLGGQRVTYGRSTFDQTAYDKAMADYQNQLKQWEESQGGQEDYFPGGDADLYRGGNVMLGQMPRPKPVAPTKEQFTTMTDLDTPFIEQYLNPEAEAAIKAQQRVQEQYARLGEKAFATVAPQFETPFRPDLPEMAQRLSGYGEIGAAPTLSADYRTGFAREALPTGPNLMAFGQAVGGPVGLDVYTPALAGGQGIAQGPTAGLYGLAGGGPSAIQLGNLDLSGVSRVQAGPQGGQFGIAAGGPAAPGQIVGADIGGVGGVSYGPQEGQYGYAQGFVPAQQLQERFDLRNVAAMPISAGATAQQAIFSRLTPQLQQRRAALENQLANQGIPRGSEAYREAMTELSQQENDLVQQAALQGINLDLAARGQGFQEAQAQAQLLNQARQAQFGMGTTQLGLYNQALQQNLAQGLSVQEARNRAQAQDLQQRLAMGQFGREGQQIAFQMGQSAQEAQNRAIAQNFQQSLAAQQAANAAQAQQYQQAMGTGEFARQQALAQFGMSQQAQQAQNQAIAQNFAQAQAAQQAANAAQTQAFQQRAAEAEFVRSGQLASFETQRTAQQMRNQAIAQNQAAAMQQYQAEMARQAQGFGQEMDLMGLYNQAINARNATALQQYQAQLGAQGQQFNQAQAEAAFRNAARTQALQEQAALRAQPLNEIAALMGGSQVQMPQFQGYTGAPVAPAPVFGAAQAQAQFAQNNYANQIAAYNAQQQGLYGLGAAGIQGYLGRG